MALIIITSCNNDIGFRIYHIVGKSLVLTNGKLDEPGKVTDGDSPVICQTQLSEPQQHKTLTSYYNKRHQGFVILGDVFNVSVDFPNIFPGNFMEAG